MFVAGYGLHVTFQPERPGETSPEGGLADGVQVCFARRGGR